MSLLTPSPARTTTETLRAIPRRRRTGLHTPPPIVRNPPAFNYDRRIGEIWHLELGVYDGEPVGDRIGVADPSLSQGGYYDNR